jgi:hypothetical protein
VKDTGKKFFISSGNKTGKKSAKREGILDTRNVKAKNIAIWQSAILCLIFFSFYLFPFAF